MALHCILDESIIANSCHMPLYDIQKFADALFDEDFDVDGEFCLLPTVQQPMTLAEIEEMNYFEREEIDVYFQRDRSGAKPAFALR